MTVVPRGKITISNVFYRTRLLPGDYWYILVVVLTKRHRRLVDSRYGSVGFHRFTCRQ